jgi:2-dehydro-3-deoxygluconokinase
LNVAWTLRALVPASVEVSYLTMIGIDPLSDRMLAFLRAAGLDTAPVMRHPTLIPGLYTIANDATGERYFTYWRSASAARHLADDADRLREAVARADLVYLSGITLAILAPDRRAALLEALGQRNQRKFKVALDPNIRPRLWESPDALRETIMAAAALSDIVVPSFDDEAAAFGDATPQVTLARYGARGVGEIIVKNGTQPTQTLVAGERADFPVQPNPMVLDTTGAGDSFNGAYLAARLSGATVATAVRKAQTVASEVVGHRGALCEVGLLRDANRTSG